jgi:hypothetical protein
MRQRGHDPQSLGAGIKSGRQLRPALVVLLFPQRPGLVFDNVLIYRRDQAPGYFKST